MTENEEDRIPLIEEMMILARNLPKDYDPRKQRMTAEEHQAVIYRLKQKQLEEEIDQLKIKIENLEDTVGHLLYEITEHEKKIIALEQKLQDAQK